MSTFFDDVFTLLNEENDTERRYCLISQEPLEPEHIKLECGHAFNRKHIFKEVVKQKTHINNCEIQKLSLKQLKCPYCRNVQNRLLPFKEGDEPIYGVNTPLKYCMFPNKCSYVFKKGKRKGETCDVPCHEGMCKTHLSVVKRKQCIAVLKTNKNKQCSKSAIKNSDFCSIHSK